MTFWIKQLTRDISPRGPVRRQSKRHDKVIDLMEALKRSLARHQKASA